jgi:phospholipid/cholesterol/gamma-HCH transport system substrate-binding protein
MPQSRLAAVGAFVIFGVLLFAVGLFLIGDRRMLFARTFEVYAEFSEIAGLQNGAKVRVAGMDAGEVEELHVPGGPSAKFRVRMRVREDLHQLLRLDSVASIQNDGLVGNKFVQIESGSDKVPVVPDKGTIQSREPFDLADLFQKMSDAIDTVNTTVTQVKGQVDDAIGAISETAKDTQDLMNDVGSEARAIMASTRKVSEDLNVIVAGVRQGRGTVGKVLNDETLYASAKRIIADAQAAVASLRQASEEAKGAVADFRGEHGPARGLTGNLQQTLASARDAMADLAENTEALKRNFLFRGFFNRRGFFDLKDVSTQDYRAGALESKNRRAIRIWLGAPVLLEKDANGVERLTDDGRARLDSAMSQFVRYPIATTPFVIEGYAREDTEGGRFLLSRTRAQLVRDYLVGKFALNPNYVAIMPLGSEAPDSPAGKTWDGVALALFIPTKSS